VVFAEPNYIGSLALAAPDEFYPTNQKAVYDLIHLEQAWEVTRGSMDVKVAVLDSGIDLTHPDFAGRILPGWNFLTNDSNVQDRIGHGTRVAGIIGARGGDTGPGSGMSGVCWEVGLIPVVVAAPNGEITTDRLVEAIDWAWRQGADVINMSLVVEAKSQALEAECNIASNHAVLVAAAGNEGSDAIHFRGELQAGQDLVISVRINDQRLQYVDVHTFLLDNLLVKSDRLSMAHSLEVRVPLLDRALVEFGLSLPPWAKVSRTKSKRLLRALLRSELPAAARRPKRGFEIPVDAWFRHAATSPMRHALRNGSLVRSLGFDGRAIDAFFERHLGGEDVGRQLFALATLEAWARRHLGGMASAPGSG